jgi:hypothetical protein
MTCMRTHARTRARARTHARTHAHARAGYLNDVHRLDAWTLRWTSLAANDADGAPARPRLFFSVVAAPNLVYVLGGTSDTEASY